MIGLLNRASTYRTVSASTNVRYGSLTEITPRWRHVRFTPDSGHSTVQVGCPKSANSGLRSSLPWGGRHSRLHDANQSKRDRNAHDHLWPKQSSDLHEVASWLLRKDHPVLLGWPGCGSN